MSGFISRIPFANEAVNALRELAFGSTGGVTLGDFAFSGMEVPEFITLGGTQAMTVHKLPGGDRVIDLLGHDDRDLEWSGIIIDGDATGRVQQLDQMRIDGELLPLVWGEFAYSVVIKTFEAETRFSRYNYRICCTVQTNEAAALQAGAPDLGDSVLGDIASAVNTVSDTLKPVLQTAQTAVATLGRIIPGSPLLAQAQGFLGSASGALSIASAGANGALSLVSGAAPSGGIVANMNDLASAVSNSGIAAQAQAGLAYVGRAVRNLTP